VTDEPLGSHVLELQVADVVKETDDARSLVFTVPEGVDIPADRLRYAPGQFLTLRVPSDRTGCVARCYSLCSSPHTGDPLTVTVKRTDGGYASHWLCDNAHAGMRIHALAPSGNFVPKTLDTDFLLMAAGSGITPMMSICKSALAEGSGKVVMIYANRDENSVIFGGALRELAAKYPDRFLCLEVRRDLLVERYTPFEQMRVKPAAADRFAAPVAKVIDAWLRPR
jgi:3-ketosteroid 9alpha-monooxygenase subunit B